MTSYIPDIVRPYIESITGTNHSKTNNQSKYQTSSTGSKSPYNWSSIGFAGTTTAFANTSTNLTSSFGSIIAYLFSILVIILVIVLFIHYFITPIIKLKPGAPGIVLIPGFDDGVLFWNKGMVNEIKNKELPIQNMYYDYTINIDVFIQNPTQFARQPRILFTRGATKTDMQNSTAMNSTILSMYKKYNLAVALAPDTNDLIISVLNKDNGMEEVKLSNIPIQEPFRLGIVVMEKALEVYINGRLMKTRTFNTNLQDITGDIIPYSGLEANITKLRNLKIWSRVLTTPEIREAKPTLSTSADMGAGEIPVTSSCN